METLQEAQVAHVCGANKNVNKKIATKCEKLPDSAIVTVIDTLISGASTIFGGGADTYTVEVTVSCGDFRRYQAKMKQQQQQQAKQN